jgi:hypothetical protein
LGIKRGRFKRPLFDYLSWRGDLSFEHDPINEIDITAFALLVYLDYNDIVGENEEITLAQAAERFIILGKKIIIFKIIATTVFTLIFFKKSSTKDSGNIKNAESSIETINDSYREMDDSDKYGMLSFVHDKN